MSEKIGYPNPNYTDEDIGTEPIEMKEEIMIDETVVISPDKFEKLCAKAAALDILTAHITKTGKVDDYIVFAVTGTTDIRIQTKADDYYKWWCEAREERDKLKEEVSKLDHARKELIEILKQNKIGPYAEETGEPCTEGEVE